MAHLFGREYSRTELLKHVGDISQVARAKAYRLAEGFEEGVLAVDLTIGSGLDFTVLPSRGMDISSAHFNGKSLAWRSAITDKHPAYFEEEGRGWLRSFYGGLVLTCGLTWMGMDCVDDEQPLGLHGRVSHLPATNVQWDGEWDGDDYIVSVSGKMREAIVFGENIQLTRKIWARMGENRFYIDDVVENMGYQTTPHMFLYHINTGFPAVDDNSRLLSPSEKVTPRDAIAEDGKERFAHMQPPTPDYQEKAYFHDMQADADGKVTTAVVNPDCDGGEGFGVYVTYNRAELPWFCEWKMMDQGTYVVGMEPANALVLGRSKEKEAGRVQYIEPGERREYHLEIGVVSGKNQLAEIEAKTRLR